MREQVERRSGKKVQQQLLDGGYLRNRDIERAHEQGRGVVRAAEGSAYGRGIAAGNWRPKRTDSAALRRLETAHGQRGRAGNLPAAGGDQRNGQADLRSYRGLTQITVRGLHKARCVALWCALAYNVMHFARLC